MRSSGRKSGGGPLEVRGAVLVKMIKGPRVPVSPHLDDKTDDGNGNSDDDCNESPMV